MNVRIANAKIVAMKIANVNATRREKMNPNKTSRKTTSQKEWDEYFMSLAYEVAKKSKDPSSKNGCIIVDERRRPVSFGYGQ